MTQAAAKMKLENSENANSISGLPVKIVSDSGVEKDPTSEFIVGALLYSLFSPNRCETVSELLAESEQS